MGACAGAASATSERSATNASTGAWSPTCAHSQAPGLLRARHRTGTWWHSRDRRSALKKQRFARRAPERSLASTACGSRQPGGSHPRFAQVSRRPESPWWLHDLVPAFAAEQCGWRFRAPVGRPPVHTALTLWCGVGCGDVVCRCMADRLSCLAPRRQPLKVSGHGHDQEGVSRVRLPWSVRRALRGRIRHPV
jgi:hypothetical protein